MRSTESVRPRSPPAGVARGLPRGWRGARRGLHFGGDAEPVVVRHEAVADDDVLAGDDGLVAEGLVRRAGTGVLHGERDAREGGGVGAGEVEAEVSFGRDGVWNGFSTKGDDGSNVTYERA